MEKFSFRIRRPDDWHLHLRDGAMLETVAPLSAKYFHRGLVMPNLVPCVESIEAAESYFTRIQKAAQNPHFEPRMTLYLTANVTPDVIEQVAKHDSITAIKFYPAGVTTNSDAGVSDVEAFAEVFKAMERCGVPLCIHGEVSDETVDVFDREECFIDEVLKPLNTQFPKLRIVCEHITTRAMADFVAGASDNIAATITPQHLLCNRNDMLGKCLNPHLYCKPILKREEDRLALLELVMSGHPRVFAGTDSAPHPQHKKESACGCAGVFSSPIAVALYAEAFDSAAGLENEGVQKIFERFLSVNGAEFYGVPVSEDFVTLTREDVPVPDSFGAGEAIVKSYRAGETVAWKVV